MAGIGNFFDDLGSIVSNAISEINSRQMEKQYKEGHIALKNEYAAIEKELIPYYTSIGEQYVNFLLTSNKFPVIDIRKTLSIVKTKIERKKELEKKLQEFAQLEENQRIADIKVKYQQEYAEQKSKLDKAMVLGIIEQAEYEETLAKYKNRIDRFDEVMKVEADFKAGIIDDHERKVRLFELDVAY